MRRFMGEWISAGWQCVMADEEHVEPRILRKVLRRGIAWRT